MSKNHNDNEEFSPEDFFNKSENEILINASDEEKTRLLANDALLKSKGYVIFTVTETGDFKMVIDNTNLNEAEYKGLLSWAQNELEALDYREFGDMYKYEQEENEDDNENNLNDYDDEIGC